jgi:hypothetical protein
MVRLLCRQKKRAHAKKNKVEKNVIFYNDFVELENLKEFIGAADLYITPYLNEAQITSGTLAYTFGGAKPWLRRVIGSLIDCSGGSDGSFWA